MHVWVWVCACMCVFVPLLQVCNARPCVRVGDHVHACVRARARLCAHACVCARMPSPRCGMCTRIPPCLPACMPAQGSNITSMPMQGFIQRPVSEGTPVEDAPLPGQCPACARQGTHQKGSTCVCVLACTMRKAACVRGCAVAAACVRERARMWAALHDRGARSGGPGAPSSSRASRRQH